MTASTAPATHVNTIRRSRTDELARVQKDFLRTVVRVAAFDLVSGGLVYASMAYFLVTFPRRRPARVFDRLDLHLAPAEAIAVIAALLAVVLSINVAVAVLTLPANQQDRIFALEWHKYVALTAQLMAMATVLMCLIDWMSKQRSHSWGASIGSTLLTSATIALAAAVRLRSNDLIAKELDRYLKIRERKRLKAALDMFIEAHPSSRAGWSLPAAGVLLLAVILALVCTSVATLVATLYHAPMSIPAALVAFWLSAFVELLLLTAGSRIWHVAIAKSRGAAVLEVIPVGFFAILWLVVGLTIALSVQAGAARAVAFAYVGVSVALPAAVILGDRWTTFGGLTLPLRQASRRRLDLQLKLLSEDRDVVTVRTAPALRPKARRR